jgi:hypothetical protein
MLFELLKSRLGYGDIYEGLFSNGPVPVQGWVTDYYPASLKEYLSRRPIDEELVIVEVGTWKGASAIQAANIIRDLGRRDVVICVDTWLGSPEHFRGMPKKAGFPTIYYEFLQNVVNHGHTGRILPLALPSLQAVEVLKVILSDRSGADVIYIDAAHEYLPVYLDIMHYWPLLRSGGRMLGDDYTQHWPGVRQAVDQYFSEKHMRVEILNEWVWKVDRGGQID